MADRKITDLTALAAGSQATGDLLTIVDVSEVAATDKNKKITVESLFKGIPGNVGIGTASPQRALVVSDAGDEGFEFFPGSSDTGNTLNHFDRGSSAFIDITTNADQHIFGRADGEKMRINSSGNVGIGTTNPTQKLSLENGTFKISGASTFASNVEIGRVGGDNNLGFATGGTERVRIDTSGRLLVATTSSTANSNADDLQIGAATDSGERGITVASSAAGSIRFADDGNDTAGYIFYSHSDNSLRLGANGSERVRIDSSGRLLVGTSTAGAFTNRRVSIATVSGTTALELRSATDGDSRIVFTDSTDSSNSGSYKGQILYDQTSDYMSFNTNGNNERMRINNVGRFFFNETSSDLGHKYIFSGNESTAIAAFQYNSNSGTYLAIKTEAANGLVELRADARSGTFPALMFKTGNVDRGRITKDGDYLVGTDDPTEYSLTRGRLGVAVASTLGNMHGLKVYHANTSFSETGGGIKFTGCRRSASSGYSFGGWYSGNGSTSVASDKEFNLRGDGNAYADGSWNGGGADYAEYFEWSDGNTSDEDRRGISVVLDGDKIREAVAGEEPIGVISGNPSVVGDVDIDRWKGKYLRDDFGTELRETHNVVKWTETITDEDGNESIKEHDYEDWNLPEGIVVPDDAVVSAVDENGKPFTHRILNPDYNPDTAYISREDRPEWATVGLMGKLRIRKGQVTGTRWIKMRDVSDTVEEWLVR